MLRSEFAKLLDSIIIPEGINQECMESQMRPISDALMSMLHKSCIDIGVVQI